jgi:hypothetical protein
VHDGFSKDEGYDKDTIDGVDVVDIDGLLNIDDNGPFYFDGVHNDEHESSSTLVNQTFSQLQDAMVEIITKCETSANLQLYDHAISLTRQVALDILVICLTHANESMHLGMVFNLVEYKFKNLVSWLKGWHETMSEHANSRNKRNHK